MPLKISDGRMEEAFKAGYIAENKVRINVKNTIFLSKISASLKFLTEKKIIKAEKRSPKLNE